MLHSTGSQRAGPDRGLNSTGAPPGLLISGGSPVTLLLPSGAQMRYSSAVTSMMALTGFLSLISVHGDLLSLKEYVVL